MDVSPTQDQDCQNVVRMKGDLDAMLDGVEIALNRAMMGVYEKQSASAILGHLANARRVVSLARRDLQGGEACS